MRWIAHSSVSIKDSNARYAEALLDSSYPEHVSDLPGQAPFYYYTVFHGLRSDNIAFFTFEFQEAVQIQAVKVRGENYSNMNHMPKDMVLYFSDDEGESWQEVAKLTAKPQRGWQLFAGNELGISTQSEAQELSNLANNSDIRGVGSNEEWMADTSSDEWRMHNAVDLILVEWVLPNPTKYYKLEIVTNHGSYLALAEINFLAFGDVRVIICLPQGAGEHKSVAVSCLDLSGSLVGTIECELQDTVSCARDQLAEHLSVNRFHLRLVGAQRELLGDEVSVAELLNT